MEYRVEKKYVVTEAQLTLLEQKLRHLIPPDPHQTGDRYPIRSLYFDDAFDRCMDENEAGISQRQKFRIRTYDPDSGQFRLEIKEKLGNLTKKTGCPMDPGEVRSLLTGPLPLTFDSRAPLNQLKLEMRCSHMQPRAIISYERSAFVFGPGNVRITFDRNITASRACDRFFCRQVPGQVPVLPTGIQVLEVKYDEFIPDFLVEQLQLGDLRHSSFSKYYLGRLALTGQFPVSR